MKRKVESKTAETILQKPMEIKVGDATYEVAPPSTATIILVSELVAELPRVNMKPDDYISESLAIARKCRVEGQIVATMILGASRLKKMHSAPVNRFFGLFNRRKDELQELSEKLLIEITPKELRELSIKLISLMEIDDFFSLIASLMDVNITGATRNEEKEEATTTTFGH